jgi:hypothetical protein
MSKLQWVAEMAKPIAWGLVLAPPRQDFNTAYSARFSIGACDRSVLHSNGIGGRLHVTTYYNYKTLGNATAKNDFLNPLTRLSHRHSFVAMAGMKALGLLAASAAVSASVLELPVHIQNTYVSF